MSLFENEVCPRMHLDPLSRRIAIKPADVARRIVEAHESVNGCNLCERRIDGPVCPALSQTLDVNTHDRPQPGLRPLSGPMA